MLRAGPTLLQVSRRAGVRVARGAAVELLGEQSQEWSWTEVVPVEGGERLYVTS